MVQKEKDSLATWNFSGSTNRNRSRRRYSISSHDYRLVV